MRAFVAVVAAGVLAGATLSALLTPSPADAQDELPDVSGRWSGKAKVRTFHLNGTERNRRRSFDAAMDVEQQGADVTVTLTIAGDQGPEIHALTGFVGRGTLWAAGGGVGSATTVSVRVNTRSRLMRGTGISADADASDELQLVLKRPRAN